MTFLETGTVVEQFMADVEHPYTTDNPELIRKEVGEDIEDFLRSAALVLHLAPNNIEVTTQITSLVQEYFKNCQELIRITVDTHQVFEATTVYQESVEDKAVDANVDEIIQVMFKLESEWIF